MEHLTVAQTVKHQLCTGCGICKGVCPKECIQWKRKDGLYIPVIDSALCIQCGLCAAVCPGLGHNYTPAATAAATVTGTAEACFNAWSSDPEIRHWAASGGVVSTLAGELLKLGRYDAIFSVDSYDYREQLTTHLCTSENYPELEKTPKSRYLPVSHENAAAYVKTHRDARIIFIGTPCALRGFEAVLEKLHLDRENYLLIGLFCDKIFSYDILPYFEKRFCPGKTVTNLHFKNKDSGGWPGNMKFFPAEGEPFFVSKDERQKAKEYYMPERCWYCLDKLNVRADISFGDNYTEENSSKLGSNSVIVRTARGMEAWNLAQGKLERYPVELSVIEKAQDIHWRLNNLYYGDLKRRKMHSKRDLNQGVPREENFKIFDRRWHENLEKIRTCQKCGQDISKLTVQMEQDKKPDSRLMDLIKRAWYLAKRKLF